MDRFMGKFSEALKKAHLSTPGDTGTRAAGDLSQGGRLEAGDAACDRENAPPLQNDRLFSGMPIDERLRAFLETGSPPMESFRMLRAKILNRDSGSRVRTIMVTSALPEEGKTLVAVCLAFSIAMGIDEYVLLVDCDLRKGSLNRVLGIEAGAGVSEYLEKGESIGPYLLATGVPKLTLLPAGRMVPNPSELLSSEKMKLLVTELKSRYNDRYIIFDATPAQFAAETSFLSSMVDGVILVERSGKTSVGVIKEAIGNIDRNKILGVVFNASDEKPKKYYDYYYGKKAA